jgi:hypothetical protein
MKTRLVMSFGLAVSLLMICVSVFAHHGGSEYDTKNLVTMKGTVTEFFLGQPSLPGSFRREGLFG